MRQGFPDLRGRTVVVVGASSGIGRATAHAFARRHACVVLGARRADMLEQVAGECRRLGGQALAVPMDVTEPGSVRHLLDSAVDAFGRVHVWINNVGTGAVGWFEQVPLAVHRRVIETNLMGALHGCHTIIPHFIDHGRGVLINMASVGAWVAPPLAAAYTASKYGIEGLTEAVRQDMRRFPGIAVSAIYPSFVDTPGLRHYGNYTGHALNIGGPLQAPEEIARAMVSIARHPRNRVPVGLPSRLGRLGYALFPDLVGSVLTAGMGAAVARARPGPDQPGNLFRPSADRRGVHGVDSLTGRTGLSPWIIAAGGLAGLAAGAVAVRERPGRGG